MRDDYVYRSAQMDVEEAAGILVEMSEHAFFEANELIDPFLAWANETETWNKSTLWDEIKDIAKVDVVGDAELDFKDERVRTNFELFLVIRVVFAEEATELGLEKDMYAKFIFDFYTKTNSPATYDEWIRSLQRTATRSSPEPSRVVEVSGGVVRVSQLARAPTTGSETRVSTSMMQRQQDLFGSRVRPKAVRGGSMDARMF